MEENREICKMMDVASSDQTKIEIRVHYLEGVPGSFMLRGYWCSIAPAKVEPHNMISVNASNITKNLIEPANHFDEEKLKEMYDYVMSDIRSKNTDNDWYAILKKIADQNYIVLELQLLP